MIESTAGSHFEWAFSSRPVIRPGSLQCSQNVAPWGSFSFSDIGRITRGEVWQVGKFGDDCHFHWSQKLPHKGWCVAGRIVMVQGPGIIMPLRVVYYIVLYISLTQWKTVIWLPIPSIVPTQFSRKMTFYLKNFRTSITIWMIKTGVLGEFLELPTSAVFTPSPDCSHCQ